MVEASASGLIPRLLESLLTQTLGLLESLLTQTLGLLESLLTQTLVIHIIRTAKIPFVQSRASEPLIAASLIVCAVGLALPYTPAAQALKFTPLPALYWPILGGFLFSYAMLTQIVKNWFVRRWGM